MHWHHGNFGFRMITTFKFSRVAKFGAKCEVDHPRVHQDKCDAEVEKAAGNYTLNRNDLYHESRAFLYAYIVNQL